MAYETRFGSLDEHDQGGVEVIDDDPRHYVFSNMFDVARRSEPWEQVAVGKNQEYVLEVVRAEGESMWRTAAHDQFALVMDGAVEIELCRPEHDLVAHDAQGSIGLPAAPEGQTMGRVRAGKGHMTLLPGGAAYRCRADRPSVLLIQTIEGPDTRYRWSQICQTY